MATKAKIIEKAKKIFKTKAQAKDELNLLNHTTEKYFSDSAFNFSNEDLNNMYEFLGSLFQEKLNVAAKGEAAYLARELGMKDNISKMTKMEEVRNVLIKTPIPTGSSDPDGNPVMRETLFAKIAGEELEQAPPSSAAATTSTDATTGGVLRFEGGLPPELAKLALNLELTIRGYQPKIAGITQYWETDAKEEPPEKDISDAITRLRANVNTALTEVGTVMATVRAHDTQGINVTALKGAIDDAFNTVISLKADVDLVSNWAQASGLFDNITNYNDLFEDCLRSLDNLNRHSLINNQEV